LRDLRNTIKRTQSQFAQMLGVARITVNKIENGQMKLPLSLAAKIHVLTGISLEELRKGPEGKLIDPLGNPYSAARFVWWQKKFRKPDKNDATLLARNLRFWIWILLQAAARQREGVAYRSVVMALNESLNAIRKDFRLVEATDAVLREFSPRVEWLPGARTPSELRQIERELQNELARAAEIPHDKITWYQPPPSKRPSKKRRRR
jgi:DNA-binding XRE family transcriptional regulator